MWLGAAVGIVAGRCGGPSHPVVVEVVDCLSLLLIEKIQCQRIEKYTQFFLDYPGNLKNFRFRDENVPLQNKGFSDVHNLYLLISCNNKGHNPN